MNPTHQELLLQKINDLPFTEGLKTILNNEGFETLQELLKLEVYNWHEQIPGFSYHHQHEIVSYLMNNNLSRYLKEE